MTTYFKVYLTSKNLTTLCVKAENKAKVLNLLSKANKEGYTSYIIIKCIKGNTDITISRGTFDEKFNVKNVKGLNTDWRIVGINVVDWDKHKEFQKGEDR